MADDATFDTSASALFRKIDSNGDGRIDLAEIRAMSTLLNCQLSDVELSHLFADMTLGAPFTEAKFTAALERRVQPAALRAALGAGAAAPAPRDVAAAFAAFNRRGAPRGKLHVADLRAMLRAYLPRAEERGGGGGGGGARGAAAGRSPSRSRSPRAPRRAGGGGGARPRAAEDPPAAASPALSLEERVEALVAAAGAPDAAGHIAVEELVYVLLEEPEESAGEAW
jgi:hypothetical protein